jgi:hypothetical protein
VGLDDNHDMGKRGNEPVPKGKAPPFRCRSGCRFGEDAPGGLEASPEPIAARGVDDVDSPTDDGDGRCRALGRECPLVSRRVDASGQAGNYDHTGN